MTCLRRKWGPPHHSLALGGCRRALHEGTLAEERKSGGHQGGSQTEQWALPGALAWVPCLGQAERALGRGDP